MKKNISYGLIMALVLMLLPISLVYAQGVPQAPELRGKNQGDGGQEETGPNNPGLQLTESQNKFMGLNANQIERCQRVEARVADKVTKFTENQTLRMRFYNQIQNALQLLINRQQTQGKPTDDLVAMQAMLETKVMTLNQAAAEYQAMLGMISTVPCSQDQAGFLANLKKSNTALQTFNKAKQDLQTFVRTKLYPLVNKKRVQNLTTSRAISPRPEQEGVL